MYRDTIDEDIHEKGIINSVTVRRGRVISGKRALIKPGFSSYNISVATPRKRMSFDRSSLDRSISLPDQRQVFANAMSYTPKPNPLKRFTPWNKGGRSQSKNKRMVPKRGPDGKILKSKSNTSTCSLCGMRNHVSQNCRNMVNDAGQKIDIIPTYGTCSKCPQNVQPGCHHPDSLCPYRKGGPLAHLNKSNSSNFKSYNVNYVHSKGNNSTHSQRY